ncbi:unnamed protein product [Rangifer tarandus platyrhynchus]|uniref:Uncharacterized protein n=1 Tax=Rangifer tarandus platyrhynchus TaxID=3082113 RepID=A0ABN8ZH70_RANTA|nr:unnamed protein product [Rangifer tarandus platyrhynchus]
MHCAWSRAQRCPEGSNIPVQPGIKTPGACRPILSLLGQLRCFAERNPGLWSRQAPAAPHHVQRGGAGGILAEDALRLRRWKGTLLRSIPGCQTREPPGARLPRGRDSVPRAVPGAPKWTPHTCPQATGERLPAAKAAELAAARAGLWGCGDPQLHVQAGC